MNTNPIVKILSSIPVILIALYFLPILGILLLILRYFVVTSRKKIWTPIILLTVGVLLLIPKCIDWIAQIANIEKTTIPFLIEIAENNWYITKLINYSKLLLYLGIIFLIIMALINFVASKTASAIKSYIKKEEQTSREISSRNDLIMKEKREKAKNTGYVKCPYCGSDNLVSEKFGICAYCRRKIENKNYHG